MGRQVGMCAQARVKTLPSVVSLTPGKTKTLSNASFCSQEKQLVMDPWEILYKKVFFKNFSRSQALGNVSAWMWSRVIVPP